MKSQREREKDKGIRPKIEFNFTTEFIFQLITSLYYYASFLLQYNKIKNKCLFFTDNT
jgi:hypothetical protein